MKNKAVAGLKRIQQTTPALTGFDPMTFLRAIKNIPRFFSTLRLYSRLSKKNNSRGNFMIGFSDMFPILSDFSDSAGVTKGHYFHQDLWFARKIYQARPKKHIDIGSRVDGFVSSLLAFMPVTVLDVRHLNSNVTGLTFAQQDATRLSDFADNSVESISTLHAIEHFGLGRYGDPVSPTACFEAMQSLSRVLKPGGKLYFSVPIGRERLEFNAHRIFDPMTILNEFKNLELVSFAAVNDAGDLDTSSKPEAYRQARFSCGLFEFTKQGNKA